MQRLMVWLCVAVAVLAVGFYLWDVDSQAKAQQEVLAATEQAELRIATAPRKPVEVQGLPVRIVIPSLVIDLPVSAGRFIAEQRTWSVDNSVANYIPETVPVTNTGGTSFIYGHNSNKVLGKTKDIADGSLVYVYTDNGHLLTYRYQSAMVVKPTDSWVLNDLSDKPGLMIMTCTGVWSEDRRIMTFTLERAV